VKESRILQDTDRAITVMYNAASWMEKSGIPLSQWWEPQNMNPAFLLQHSEPNEFYVAVVAGKPAASVILQETERNQSWKPIDGDAPQHALYIHWLCVARDFSGQGYSKLMVDFAAGEAKKRDLSY
jgi:ribosomal protein S18 acetylase RimI-like enzyme